MEIMQATNPNYTFLGVSSIDSNGSYLRVGRHRIGVPNHSPFKRVEHLEVVQDTNSPNILWKLLPSNCVKCEPASAVAALYFRDASGLPGNTTPTQHTPCTHVR